MGTGCGGGGEETSASCEEGGAPSSQSQGVSAAVVRVEKGQEAKMVALSMTVAASTQALLTVELGFFSWSVVEVKKKVNIFYRGISITDATGLYRV